MNVFDAATPISMPARIEDGVDLARHLRTHHVRDRHRARSGFPRQLQRLDRVARLTRLRDADDEVVLVDDRIAIDPFAGDVELDGDAGPLLDHVAADDACVVRSAGGEEDDPAELLDVLAGHVEPLEDEGSMANSIADRLGDGLGLLEDLLEHEGLEARFLGAFVVPVELDGLVLGQGPIGVLEACTGPQLDDLAVARKLHVARLTQERGRIRCEEHLVRADPDDEWHLMACADEKTRMVVMDDDECEMALEPR